MPQNFLKIVFVSIFAYLFALILMRFVGRKAVSQMTFFDFIMGVSIGTITANIALGPNRFGAVVVLVIFVLLTIISDYLHIDSFKLRKLINSEPIVIIENGKIIEENLRRARLAIEELNMQLREKNVFNVSDVEFAVVEVNGKLSVLPKSQKQPLTPSDLGLSTSYKGLTRDIIIDGNVMSENLYDANLNPVWLSNNLKKQGISDVKEVFYAGLDTSGNLYVSQRRRNRETEGKHGIE